MENELVATVGEGENRTNGESSINIYAVAYVRWIIGEKVLCSTGIPGSTGSTGRLCDDHEGWEGAGEGSFGGRGKERGRREVMHV